MANNNCLEGMRCPNCGSEGPFSFDAVRRIRMGDSGVEEESGDTEWTDRTEFECEACGHTEAASAFSAVPSYQIADFHVEGCDEDPDHLYVNLPSGMYVWISYDALRNYVRVEIKGKDDDDLAGCHAIE